MFSAASDALLHLEGDNFAQRAWIQLVETSPVGSWKLLASTLWIIQYAQAPNHKPLTQTSHKICAELKGKAVG